MDLAKLGEFEDLLSGAVDTAGIPVSVIKIVDVGPIGQGGGGLVAKGRGEVEHGNISGLKLVRLGPFSTATG